MRHGQRAVESASKRASTSGTGDLFAPVAGERFDLVLFNLRSCSASLRTRADAAWRSSDGAERFAAGLAGHLKPAGSALLMLSSYGEACVRYEAELRAHGFRLEVFARRRYPNETLTIVRAATA